MTMIKHITIMSAFIFMSFATMAERKSVKKFDRDGDHYSEEKQSIYSRNNVVLKIVTEIDSNKDQKVDILKTSYYHYEKMKIYILTKKDTNFDLKWDKKQVKIEKLVPYGN